MSMRIKYWVVIIGLLAIIQTSEACRFTIREIGYSPLNLGYFVLELEIDTVKNRKLANEFTNLAYAWSIDANVKYKVTHQPDSKTVLKCVDNEGELIVQQSIDSAAAVKGFINALLYSHLQQTMGEQMGQAFAFVVCFFENKEKEYRHEVDKALAQFRQVAPNLDKEISEEIVQIELTAAERKREALLLKSMGLRIDETKPMVVVLYGRGRLVGRPLIGQQITTQKLFRQLVILGTDCECGIDLSPLLKKAIPFSWDEKVRQDVSDMLGFDVDNPMIQSEMAQILSKATLNERDGDLSFAPQMLEINGDFGPLKKSSKEAVKESSGYLYPLLIIGLIACVIIGIGLFIVMRK